MHQVTRMDVHLQLLLPLKMNKQVPRCVGGENSTS